MESNLKMMLVSGWLLLMLGLLPVVSVSVLDRSKLIPCKFNPLCLCSSNGEDLGAVECTDIPLGDIPEHLVDSRVFALTLVNNNLRTLDEDRLRNMGCWSVEIAENRLTSLPPAAFSGLERSVWRLILSKNQFSEIPNESIARLEKLNFLDLSDNRISQLAGEQVQALSPSLETLILAGNSLNSVPEGVFLNLNHLIKLDLSRNNIINIHSMAFQSGLPSLSHVLLGHNQLAKIPFPAVSSITTLKTLDLSNNIIEEVADSFNKVKLKLDKLILDENQITVLTRNSFRNFEWINSTSLRGNPLHTIEAEAFLDTGIRNIDFENCHISSLQPFAFRGLERSLQFLNLGANRLSVLANNILEDLESLKLLDLSNNMLAVSPNITFSGSRFTLLNLDLSGEYMRYVNMRELGLLRNLRRVSLATLRDYGNLMLGQFEEFPPGLEELSLVGAKIKVVRSNAFYHIPSISRLDLSGNRIVKIEDNAFKEVGSSLRTLIMRNALYLTTLPNMPFQSLVSLRRLDLSDNYLVEIPLDTLHKIKNLRELYLQDNEIKSFLRGTLHSQANPHLEILDLSFNHINAIEYDTFRFPALQKLHLDDNRIEKLDARSFVEMKNLKRLTLDGNKIRELADETFQNLHSLELLSLAYNQLQHLNFDAFDYVGSLSYLKLDLSHNNIANLRWNRTSRHTTNSNIRWLDLSYNNISQIQTGFFDPISSLVKVLDLSHNQLTSISSGTLPNLRRLASLWLNNNAIEKIDDAALGASRDLQRLSLASNLITELPNSTFRGMRELQVVDLSRNQLQWLGDVLFVATKLEILNLGSNLLTEIPVKTLNPVQSTLRQIDLSNNLIEVISESQLGQIQRMTMINLSGNRIKSIDSRALCCSPSLVELSLAHNPLQVVSSDTLAGALTSLEDLNLANTSLTILPPLHLPKLLYLNMSMNKLTFVPSSSLGNITGVLDLDLSHNSLPSPPQNVGHSLSRLARLSFSHNPISSLKNESFLTLNKLEQLDISSLELKSIEDGVFGLMPNMMELKISVGKMSRFNLASRLSHNLGLRRLDLRMEGGNLLEELNDRLPPSLETVSIVAPSVTNIHPAAFKFLSSRRLNLKVVSNKLTLDKDIFLNLGQAHNLTVDVSESFGSNSSEISEGEVSLQNPATTYTLHSPNSVFLTDMVLGSKAFTCTCDSMGWLAKWLRRWRSELCSVPTSQQTLPGAPSDTWALQHPCRQTVRRLRAARCAGGGRSGHGVLDRLKDLDCLTYGGAPRVADAPTGLIVILTAVLTTVVNRMISCHS